MKALEDLTKEQLINDLIELRRRISELERIEKDKKRYEEELNRVRAMFEGLFEFAPDAILVVNHDGRIIRVNKQTERLFGYPRNELLDTPIEILLPERFREEHKEHRRKYLAGPHVRPMGRELQLYGRRKDGSEFHVAVALGPLQIEQDLFVLAVVRDFTEFKKSEEGRLREKTISDATIDNLPGIFCLIDEQGKVLRWNKNLEQASGYSALEISRMRFLDFFAGQDKETMVRSIAVLTNGHTSVEADLTSKDGSKTAYFFTESRIDIAQAQWLVGIGVDITERKRMELALRDNAANLNEVNSALKALLRQRDEDRKEFEEAVLLNVKNLVFPYFEKLRGSHLENNQKTWLDILETQLKEITSTFTRKLTFQQMNLTPTEIRVAALVRDGKTTKEIAETLGSSEKSISVHRNHIRGKLGLHGKRANLEAYLASLT
ncbi:MAG: PAS domain S-box protein [Syntrophobacteraceae bacterium]|jgi:PAS domain S-box-containing protein